MNPTDVNPFPIPSPTEILAFALGVAVLCGFFMIVVRLGKAIELLQEISERLGKKP